MFFFCILEKCWFWFDRFPENSSVWERNSCALIGIRVVSCVFFLICTLQSLQFGCAKMVTSHLCTKTAPKPPTFFRPPRFGPSADRRWSKSLGRSRTLQWCSILDTVRRIPKTSKADRDWEWLRQGVFLLLLGDFVLQLSRVLLTVSRLPIHINHLGRKRSGCTMTGNFSPFDTQLAVKKSWTVKECERSVNSSTNCRSNSQINQIIGSYLCRIFVKTCSPIYKGDRNLQYTSLFTPQPPKNWRSSLG